MDESLPKFWKHQSLKQKTWFLPRDNNNDRIQSDFESFQSFVVFPVLVFHLSQLQMDENQKTLFCFQSKYPEGGENSPVIVFRNGKYR